jgi:hypothetical protein
MERRAETRRLILGQQHGQGDRRLIGVCDHDGLDVAQIQQTALVRKDDESSVLDPECLVSGPVSKGSGSDRFFRRIPGHRRA